MSKNRMEALSDGVVAIIITIMVLARLYPLEMVRRCKNSGKLNIQGVFQLSALDFRPAENPDARHKACEINDFSLTANG
jgi:hypothetical protein